MKRTVLNRIGICWLLVLGGNGLETNAWALDVGWMQQGVRVWYLGGVDTGGVTSSNAEEAYLLGAVTGGSVQVTHHSGLDHWGYPRPVGIENHLVGDKGPCWIHPLVLKNLKAGDYWMGQEITLATPMTFTYSTFPFSFLPAKALFDLQAQREVVKLGYMIPGSSVGNAYFDSDTGLLLYYHTLWGASKLFFILSEINYDFATQTAFAEDDGPHTGFKSLVSEQSLGKFPGSGGGGSVIIQSLVETRYGETVEMRVLTSISGPSVLRPLSDQNYCFFGVDPILRCIDATQAPNVPPEQWTPCGEYLWWWVPPGALARSSISIMGVEMTRTEVNPYTFTAAGNPAGFHYSRIWFGNDGYMTRFAAADPQINLVLAPDDFVFQNLTTVYGLDYYRKTMGRAIPASAVRFPEILQPPQSATAAPGSSATFSVRTGGATGETFEWKHGNKVVGGNNSTLFLPNVQATDAGPYSVTVSLDGETVTSRAVILGVKAPPYTEKLMNISTRGQILTGPRIMIAGFVLDGSGQKDVLIRGVGPTLGQWVPGVCTDPMLALFRNTNPPTPSIAENDDWISLPGDIRPHCQRVGAFAFLDGSHDAALFLPLKPGPYTAKVSSLDGTGVGLVELYDADPDPLSSTCNLSNISTRGEVGTKAQVLIAGFVIAGDAPKQVLVRGIGPRLADFLVADTLTDPFLQLLKEASPEALWVASNDNWSDNPNAADIVTLGASVGAFDLVADSRDAAILTWLEPGAYTAKVSGVGETTGVALVEIYEVR